MCDGPTPARTSQPTAALNSRSTRVGAANCGSFVIGLLGVLALVRWVDANPAHPPRRGVDDLQYQAAVERDALARRRDVAGRRQAETGDAVPGLVFRQAEVERAVDIAHRRGAVEQHRAARFAPEQLGHLLDVLAEDLADQLLDQILHGDDALH